MRSLLIAFRFLTRYPVPEPEGDYQPGDFGKATGFYPLVGLVAGLDLLLLRSLLLFDSNGLHYPLWCLLLLLFWVWSADSLHLDGLADTTDALATRREGTEFYEVLGDPRVGAFGAMALGLALLARYAWLRNLPMRGLWFLPLPLIFSRLLASMACQIRPYAGRKGSLSSLFISEALHPDLNLAMLTAFVAFAIVALPSVFLGYATVEDCGLALGVCILGLASGWMLLKTPLSRLGGISGDLIGWATVITELCIAYGLFFVLVR